MLINLVDLHQIVMIKQTWNTAIPVICIFLIIEVTLFGKLWASDLCTLHCFTVFDITFSEFIRHKYPGVDTKIILSGAFFKLSSDRFFMLAWWPSWIYAHCIALKFFLISAYLRSVISEINIQDELFGKLWEYIYIFMLEWRPYRISADCIVLKSLILIFWGISYT